MVEPFLSLVAWESRDAAFRPLRAASIRTLNMTPPAGSSALAPPARLVGGGGGGGGGGEHDDEDDDQRDDQGDGVVFSTRAPLPCAILLSVFRGSDTLLRTASGTGR